MVMMMILLAAPFTPGDAHDEWAGSGGCGGGGGGGGGGNNS